MDQAKPCPFCGSDAGIEFSVRVSNMPSIKGMKFYKATCKNCGASAEDESTEESALESWNWRHGEEHLHSNIASLESEIESYKKAQEYTFQQGLIRNKIDEDRVKLNNAYHERISKVVKITMDYISSILPILRDKLDIHMKQKSWEEMINKGDIRNPEYLFTKIAEAQKAIAQAEALLKLLDSIDPEHYNGSATEESII